MFKGLTGSNSGLFRAPGFIVSPVGKGEKTKRKEKGKEGKRNRKEKEGRMDKGIKKIGGKKRRRNFNKN